MSTQELVPDGLPADYDEPLERIEFAFSPTRREVLALLGAGLLILVAADDSSAQSRGGRRGGGGFFGGGPKPISARVHIAKDGAITVMAGKVEAGQGSRAEITQAAAEELRISPDKLTLIMADTTLCPDDGVTAGSGTTPRTLPSVRQGCAAARELFLDFAAKHWNADRSKLLFSDGQITNPSDQARLSYADLASADEVAAAFKQNPPSNVSITRTADWKVLGTPLPRPNRQELVTGAHKYPSDITIPGMLYGKILRPAAYGAKLTSLDAASVKAMKDVTLVQDNSFVGVVAPTLFAAQKAVEALAQTAKWDAPKAISSSELFEHLRQTAQGGMPPNPFAEIVSKAAKSLKETFKVAYVQHTPMETRSAVAQWENGNLTVWTATQNPFGVRGELMRAFNLPDSKCRVIIPDFGGAFGGKHTGECAVEAARLAKAAGKPVRLQWSRSEEFTWAYFRPAALIEAEASLDNTGKITSWHFVNVNSGGNAVSPPYSVGKNNSRFVGAAAPLRHGSYRALASTANNFAREVFMDELAALAGQDPLEFRLAHLQDDRLKAVLQEAASKFDWKTRFAKKQENVGVGLACGTEKGSFVAACCEIAFDPAKKQIHVNHVSQAFECGAITNPANLVNQNKGAVIMGLGPALREQMEFAAGRILNDQLADYPVPRFADVPTIDIHLVNRPDLAPIGAGETPIIAIAPAISNALFHATGKRVRQMPIEPGIA